MADLPTRAVEAAKRGVSLAERLEGERDQLDQQVKELLEAAQAHEQLHVGGGLARYHAGKRRTDEELREAEAEADHKLWATAQRIREERGE